VETVSLYDAFAYCNKRSEMEGLKPCYYMNDYGIKYWNANCEWYCDFSADGYRLPTEAEWEYAARGGKKGRGCKYSGSDNIADVAWFDFSSANRSAADFLESDKSGLTTHDVKTKQPNELGVYDMTGNVFEWVWDNATSYNSNTLSVNTTNPTGGRITKLAASKKSFNSVSRGGCYKTDLFLQDAAVYSRFYSLGSAKKDTTGFRIVRSDVKKNLGAEVARVKKLLEKQKSSKDLSQGLVMVEGGSFSMGTDYGDKEEAPVHEVTLTGFYICDHEVMQKEFYDVIGQAPVNNKIGSYDSKDANKPIVNIRLGDAATYCNLRSIKEGLTPCYSVNGSTDPKNWPRNGFKEVIKPISCNFSANGYRLPTEAEWEYAARGGRKSRGYVFAGSNSLYDVAWCDNLYEDEANNVLDAGDTRPPVGFQDVKTKLPNELGLYDMCGNATELCWNSYSSYTSSKKTDPMRDLSVDPTYQGTLRGLGVSRNSGYLEQLRSYRITDRGGYKGNPGLIFGVGFRVVRSYGK